MNTEFFWGGDGIGEALLELEQTLAMDVNMGKQQQQQHQTPPVYQMDSHQQISRDSFELAEALNDFAAHQGNIEVALTGKEENIMVEALPESKRKSIPKVDYAVDHLEPSLLNRLVRYVDVDRANIFPLQMHTDFKKKYYRFDNKMLQCFPSCSRFEDVREARMLGLDHRTDRRAQAWCSNAIEAMAYVPNHLNHLNLNVVFAVGRFLAATPEVSVLPDSDAPLLEVGMSVGALPQANCVRGSVRETGSLDNLGRREIAVVLQPDEAWFFNLILPRHRRNAACAAHKVPLFTFELILFVRQSDSSFSVFSRSVSSPFEIASVRTLIREVLHFRQQGDGTRRSVEQMDEEDQPRRSKAIKRMPTTYSSAVHRIRLSEANRKEFSKSKPELQVQIVEQVAPVLPAPRREISVNYAIEEAVVLAETPAWMTQAFELPDINLEPLPFLGFPQHDDDDDLIP
jgi:hypothetical protein